MRPLIAAWVTTAVKVMFPVPLAAYAWALLHLQPVSAVDVVAGLLTLAGTVPTVKATLDLGAEHSWAGTHRAGQTRTHRGLYGLLSQPMARSWQSPGFRLSLWR